MNKKILLAMLMVVVLAMPAFASVQNVKVSGDIDNTWLMRNNFDLGKNIIGDRNQNVFLTQARLRVDADLTDNVSTVIGLITERSWGETNDPTANSTDVDINVAYVRYREFLYQPLTLTVGRQNDIRFGNALVLDSNGSNNVANTGGSFATVANDLTKSTALDGVRAQLDFNPLTLDLIYAKYDANTRTGAPDTNDDVDIFAADATYKLGDSMDSEVEGYFVAKIDKSTQVTTSSNKADTVYTPGLRASTNPIKGLNVQGELAWQGGNKVTTTSLKAPNQRREAFAAQAIVNYQLPFEQTEKWKPVVTGVYTHVSGDHDPDIVSDNAQPKSRERWTAWDPVLENQGGGTIYNTLYDLTNANIYVLSLSAKPMEDVTAKFTWTGLWLDKKVPLGSMTVRQPDGGTLSLTTNKGKKDVGNEFDVDLIYDLTEDAQFGLSLGWYNPGDLLTSANDATASQALLHGIVNF